MQPLRFEPFLRPMVWGGRRLASALGKPLPDAQNYGESWEVSDHASHPSIVAEGPQAGLSLRQLLSQQPADLLGAAASTTAFPWLVKFLDIEDWLSVQVHPDEQAVKTLWPGEGSKTEAWFVLEAAPGSRVYAGLREGVDAQTLRAALQKGTVADCLHSFEPKPGDCIFLPSGTVHAGGGGILLAEVQQTSDATFRLFDWNRRDAQGKSRTLHMDEALAAIHWDYGPVQPIAVPAFSDPVSASVHKELVRCPFFQLDYLRQVNVYPLRDAGRLQVLIVLRGQGWLQTEAAENPIAAGQVWVLPAALEQAVLVPDSDLHALLCTLP
jgi:mannose-6-phosphate isomerase